jgi:hypothetical protein
MPIYKIYMRSFAPWREFGEKVAPSRLYAPVPAIGPSSGYPGPRVAAVATFGGAFHGDARGFSLDTTAGGVTARVNAYIEVDLSTGAQVSHNAWCHDSRGPWMFAGPVGEATGTVDATFTVTRKGQSVHAVIEYGASNPLVKPSPDIDARGEFTLTPGPGKLTIGATITGDQFPACESFIQDPTGTKIFLGGFAPPNKGELNRLFGSMNKPQEVWFESHIVVKTDPAGSFLDLEGAGSGSNLTGPSCENVTMGVKAWNVRIMGSIPMPADAP